MSVLAWEISTSLWGTHHLTHMNHSRVRVKIWNEISREYLILSEKSFKKKKIKMGSSQQSKNSLRLYIRFLYGAWWDNTKFQTQQNWNKLNQSYNIFRSLRNARTFSPLQWTYIIFPFSFLDYFLMSFYVLFLHLCVISSVIRFKQVKFTVVKKKNWPASISICYLRVKGISGIYIYIYI